MSRRQVTVDAEVAPMSHVSSIMALWRNARHRLEATTPRVGGRSAQRAGVVDSPARPAGLTCPTRLGRLTAAGAEGPATAALLATGAEARVGLGLADRCRIPRRSG